ncbi:FAD:protein FMN transferase [Modestobacter sp. I12A-02628]|uniref:FAD:protein FMN transferase n=1 Tax=Goekera deserti TaxID=2497753 RepID=A0A7K3W933_9ACTN|nr:FAD:protein FMN transferase [Goekera deserti]MPQ98671.1 FAD:protein FMN transferase [Goekera deserti]NDI49233.1 FAD:protein FMN transferase [Goekera deserti]NEL52971.1 FAD:protein FMN transferase [Goekera deserti]
MTAAAEWSAWTCRVRLVVTDPAALAPGRALLTRRMAAVDRACSRFRADSELSLLGRAGGGWTPVSPLLAEALAVALRAAELTDGDVDPTVGGALVSLAHDGDPLGTGARAEPAVVPAPGWHTVELDRAAGRVRVPAGVLLDLGATAKAWTADRAAAEITAATGSGVLVAIGGDVAVAGPAPAGGWRVRVEDVTAPLDRRPTGPCAVVTVRSGGLATSGTRARRWQQAGLHLHHLLDPRTGLPARPVWRTVSVAAGSCVDANTVSTATVVRGDGAWPWLRAVRVPARLVTEDGAVLTVGGWPAESAA